MATHHHHGASHDLALLERFVSDCVQQLPTLPPASQPRQLPPRAADYHARCAAMLRDVVGVLAPISPRLAQLVAQIWELTSLNVFALLQLTQIALDDKDATYAKWRQLQRFGDETTAQHTRRVATYETERERTLLEARELRAELQTTRQRANRLGVENAQLRKVLHDLMEMNNPLHGVHADKLEEASSGSTPIGDAEEWDLYGISTDDLEKIDVLDPIESCAQDFDQLCEGLVDKAREQMTLLNEMDRFMNSNVVSLLWRHGPDDAPTKFLEQMMSRRTTGTQTDDDELSILNDDMGVGREAEDEEEEEEEEKDEEGETSTTMRVTKRQLLPPSLRAQLTTRPKVQRVLEKDQLSRVLLRLFIDKMENDGVALRAIAPSAQPRAPLHRFLKEFFVAHYGLVTLAEYRMMQVVKSVLYYHEKQEAEARQLRQFTETDTVTRYPHGDGSLTPAFSLLPGLEALPLGCDDLRIALFARLCELVPLQWPLALMAPVAGNVVACATNALVDFLGDVIELDRTSSSLRDVVERTPASDWTVARDLAWTLVAHHFAYCDPTRRHQLQQRLQQLEASPLMTVDALLVFFMTQWFDMDQKLTVALHDAFCREAAKQAKRIQRIQSLEDSMETLERVWRSMSNEHVPPPDMEALRQSFTTILELHQAQPHGQQSQSPQQRRVSKGPSVAVGSTASCPAAVVSSSSISAGPCIGGISEKEFVFQSQQILRARRVCRGLRTHGRGVAVVVLNHYETEAVEAEADTEAPPPRLLGPRGRPLAHDAVAINLDELKPAC